jgi:hypothetical protein
MHALFHWLFIGNGEETFVYLLQNGPHWLFEISVNVVEFGLALLIFRPLAKRWVKQHDAKHHSECKDDHEN